MAAPDISFVIVNYNYADFVAQAIDSVLAQSHEDFECIVVDNASQDHSREILKTYETADSRLRVRYFGKNMNQMGAVLSLLDTLQGRYVSIVDADDLIFSDYAARHLAVHQRLGDRIAFTSNSVIEIDGNGRALTSGFDTFLQSDAGEPAFRRGMREEHNDSQDQDGYAWLADGVTRLSGDDPGWHWSPGTANVFRLDLMKATQPSTQFTPGVPYVAATDNYFACLNHAVGGSAKISLPLSAYRLHGRNRFSARESMADLRLSRPLGTWRSIIRHRDMTEEITARASDFARLAPGRFWTVMDAPARIRGNSLTDYYTNPHVVRILRRNYASLVSALGRKNVEINLKDRMGCELFEKLRPAADAEGSHHKP